MRRQNEHKVRRQLMLFAAEAHSNVMPKTLVSAYAISPISPA